MRSSVLACYGNFYAGVRFSDAIEVRTLACVAAADVRSTTGSNLRNLTIESGVDPRENPSEMRRVILDSKCPVPDMDTWRIPCLKRYLSMRYRMNVVGEDSSAVDALILSLVTT